MVRFCLLSRACLRVLPSCMMAHVVRLHANVFSRQKLFFMDAIREYFTSFVEQRVLFKFHDEKFFVATPILIALIASRSGTCPLNKKCLTKGIVYHAKITAEDNEETRHYIGITATTFKERFRNHQKSFNIATYANDTELSKYIWSLKKSNRPYKIKWTILKHSSAYRSGRNQCNLCSDEKLFIMKFKNNSLLNKRSEIFSNCVHKKQFLAGKYIRVQSNNVRHHTRRKNAQACTRKQTKPNGQI